MASGTEHYSTSIISLIFLCANVISNLATVDYVHKRWMRRPYTALFQHRFILTVSLMHIYILNVVRQTHGHADGLCP